MIRSTTAREVPRDSAYLPLRNSLRPDALRRSKFLFCPDHRIIRLSVEKQGSKEKIVQAFFCGSREGVPRKTQDADWKNIVRRHLPVKWNISMFRIE
jgi:hypothetical protein